MMTNFLCLLTILLCLYPSYSFLINPAFRPCCLLADRAPTHQRHKAGLTSNLDGDGPPEDDDDNDQDPYTRIASSEFLEESPDDDEEEADVHQDPYTKIASSEFEQSPDDERKNGIVATSSSQPTTNIDWGGALGKLRQRVDDVESGKSQDPSHALFRFMSSKTPNQQISSFVETANPQLVQAMSGAVGSLLGGLVSPTTGVEMIVKASGTQISSLCFQLQMTGYMFRNAEYVMALKDLMKLKRSATLQDYKEAFDDLDSDGSGYIEAADVEELLDDVYDGKTPAFEIEAFLKFFDVNNDGKISWDEFERGLGTAMAQQNQIRANLGLNDNDADDFAELEPEVTGKIEVELEDGKVVEVEAKEYIESLKREAQALKDALRKEKPGKQRNGQNDFVRGMAANVPDDEFEGIANYIASRKGDLKALTEGIQPEIVETMKLLIDFVLEGGHSGKGAPKDVPKEQIEMEIPGSALQQLLLWMLVLGYRLRESEAKGDYLKLLE